MGNHENYYISQALQQIEQEENSHYERELEEQYEEEQSERYEQVYELFLKKQDYLNSWLLTVKQPLFHYPEFTKYFNTLEEIQGVKAISVYNLLVQLDEQLDQEAAEDFLYQTFDTIQFAIETDTIESLYNLPF